MNNRAELTIRGLIIGIIITLGVHCGERLLRTQSWPHFSTSIPAAVIRWRCCAVFKDATVQENNIVQTDRLGGGHALVDHFRAPGFDHDRLLERVSVLDFVLDLRARGILGVMYSIPLRRALVTQSDLPYPKALPALKY